MRKVVACVLAMAMGCAVAASAATAVPRRDGALGFCIGCCFGARSGAAYNEGKQLHWKEWGLMIPIVNIFIDILNGVDTMNGLATADLAGQYGAQYY